MDLDYRGISKRVVEAFIAFVNRTNNEALEEIEKTIYEREQKRKPKTQTLEDSI